MTIRRPHVLCVDDDRDTVALLTEELTERGFEVSAAFDGELGFQFILSELPEIVLVDVTMPTLSGFDLLERLVALSPRFNHMPFLYLTALSDRTSELRGRHLGADDYITKPVDFDILAAIMTARLAKASRIGAGHHDVALTDREIETLTWASRGKTSSEIAQIVGLTKRTVDFHIDNARVKLNASTRIHAAVKAAAGQLIEP